jgi:hypothetical protein
MSKSHGQTRGYSPTALYRAWANMRTRCNNPKSTQYPYYGARGIAVCDRWSSFEAFREDVGEKPSPKHSLDRIDPNGNYEPGNVRWATHTEQCRNRRSNRAVIRSDGEKFVSLSAAAESVSGTISSVWDACQGKTKNHRGFGWRYE